jgi:hypothetical protein
MEAATTLVLAPTPQKLHEYEAVVLNFGQYLQQAKVGPSYAKVQLHLESVPQIHNWIAVGRIPRAVWRLCNRLWGSQGFAAPRIERQRRPFLLPANSTYAELLGVKLPEPPKEEVKAPEPGPLPESVPWPIYEASMLALIHQNAQVVGALALTNKRNIELEKRMTLLQGELGMHTTLAALDAMAPAAPKLTAPNVPAEALDMLKKVPVINGNAAVLSDLERRIRPFQRGPVS